MLRDSKAFADLQDECLRMVHFNPAAVPEGTLSMALPSVVLKGVTSAALEFAANQLASRFGGLAEGFLISHREQILSAVPGVVLTLAKTLISDLTSSE